MKMFNKDFDPYDEILALRTIVENQARQLHELSVHLQDFAHQQNQHARLIKQLTEQNTQILLMWANTPVNFPSK